MAIYSITATKNAPSIMQRVIELFPSHYVLTEDAALISTSMPTARHVALELGILKQSPDERKIRGSAVVLGVGDYFGRADTEIWQWLKASMEGSDG